MRSFKRHTEALRSLVTKKMCFCKTLLNTEQVQTQQLHVFEAEIIQSSSSSFQYWCGFIPPPCTPRPPNQTSQTFLPLASFLFQRRKWRVSDKWEKQQQQRRQMWKWKLATGVENDNYTFQQSQNNPIICLFDWRINLFLFFCLQDGGYLTPLLLFYFGWFCHGWMCCCLLMNTQFFCFQYYYFRYFCLY